jgi:hypothetical protein
VTAKVILVPRLGIGPNRRFVFQQLIWSYPAPKLDNLVLFATLDTSEMAQHALFAQSVCSLLHCTNFVKKVNGVNWARFLDAKSVDQENTPQKLLQSINGINGQPPTVPQSAQEIAAQSTKFC